MKIGSTGLRQVCLVTWDLDKAERSWSQILGISAERLKTPSWEQVPSFTNGVPDRFHEEELVLFRLENNVVIEIFGPGKSPDNPWRQHLEKYGEGVMNLAFYVDDERDEAYRQIGAASEAKRPYHEGFYPSASYTFVDTMKELGVELNIKRDEDNTELIERLVRNPSSYQNGAERDMEIMKSVLGTSVPCQLAVICDDVESMKRKYASLWGVEVPPTTDGGPYEITGCEYMGQPSKTASCKMAFFDLGAIQFEIIEPYGGQSTWQDFLDETGGGLHHIAFQVEDIHEGIRACEDFGMKLTQWGKYNDASGAYAYLDARDSLGCFIELLCSFKE